MQVLDSLQSQFSRLPQRLQTSLTDIVNQIEIKSLYSIKHPSYPTIELPESIVYRFSQLPIEIQNRHLSVQLRNFIYSAYYNGTLNTDFKDGEEDKKNKLPPNLENNSLFGIDLEFYENLHTRNKSQGYWSHNWQVVREETDGTVAVYRNGLTLHVNPDVHILPTKNEIKVGKFVSIKMPKNLVQNGFYMAVANVGSQGGNQIARIYFNLTPEGAANVMESLTEELNSIDFSFSFKALYNPPDYRRYDSAVLYFNKGKYDILYPILKKIYAENQHYFQEQVPLFTKLLAPGLACAEEPDQTFADQESFGTHRCQMIANGLISAWQEGDNSSESRMAAIFKEFKAHKISMQHPYLNYRSQDIYTPL
ncbi:MAG: hypothetical protein EAZ87_09570 [Nostocales cyanobacterium]|nr:MAG: hypothetical protein EAZ87_09570 [Nostocales cyanobacterium]